MPDNPPRSARRPWRIMITGFVVFIVLLLAFALLSEREDAQVLPPEELETREEIRP